MEHARCRDRLRRSKCVTGILEHTMRGRDHPLGKRRAINVPSKGLDRLVGSVARELAVAVVRRRLLRHAPGSGRASRVGNRCSCAPCLALRRLVHSRRTRREGRSASVASDCETRKRDRPSVSVRRVIVRPSIDRTLIEEFILVKLTVVA